MNDWIKLNTQIKLPQVHIHFCTNLHYDLYSEMISSNVLVDVRQMFSPGLMHVTLELLNKDTWRSPQHL